MTTILNYLTAPWQVPAWLLVLLILLALFGVVVLIGLIACDYWISKECSQPKPTKNGCTCANQFCPDCHPENLEKPKASTPGDDAIISN